MIPNPKVTDRVEYILNPDWHKKNKRTKELRESVARLLRGQRGLDTRQLSLAARQFILEETNKLAYSGTPEGEQFRKDLDPIHLMISLDTVDNPGVVAWPPAGDSPVFNPGAPNQGHPVAGQDIYSCDWDHFLDQLSTQISPGPFKGQVGCVVGASNIVPFGQLAAPGLQPSVMFRLPPNHGLIPNVIVVNNQSEADKIVAAIAASTNNNRVVTYLTQRHQQQSLLNQSI